MLPQTSGQHGVVDDSGSGSDVSSARAFVDDKTTSCLFFGRAPVSSSTKKWCVRSVSCSIAKYVAHLLHLLHA